MVIYKWRFFLHGARDVAPAVSGRTKEVENNLDVEPTNYNDRSIEPPEKNLDAHIPIRPYIVKT